MLELKAEGYSLCVIKVEPVGDAAKRTVTHSSEVENSGSWPKIVST